MNAIANTIIKRVGNVRNYSHVRFLKSSSEPVLSIGRKEFVDKIPQELPTLLKISPSTKITHNNAAAICSAVLREGKLPFQLYPSNPMYEELLRPTILPSETSSYIKHLEERSSSFIYTSGTNLDRITSKVRSQFSFVENALVRQFKDYELRQMSPFWAPTIASAFWRRKVVAYFSITTQAAASIYSKTPLISPIEPPQGVSLHHPAVSMLDSLVMQSLRSPNDIHSDELLKVQYDTPASFFKANALSLQHDHHIPLSIFTVESISSYTIGQAILHLAANLVAGVCTCDIDVPMFSIGVITDSNNYSFVVFQLNSLDFLPGSEVKNEIWVSEQMSLIKEPHSHTYECNLEPLNHLYCMLAYIYKAKHSPLEKM